MGAQIAIGVSNATVTVKIGKEAIIRMLAHRDARVNTGILNIVIPGARILMMVTKKLIPVKVVPIPDNCTAHIQ